MSELNYSYWDLIEFLGSLALFIFGMKMMSEGIQKFAGDSLRRALSLVTENKFLGICIGFIVTALIQSSSATTVMLVSFVNAGLITVKQSIGVIMGANIGTTVTAWLVSLLGFKVKIDELALPIMAVALPMMFFRNLKWKNLGEVLFGFALLFFGLGAMKDSVPDLKQNPEVLSFLQDYASHGYLSYLLFIFIGTLVTIIVQSSSASMSITILMCAQGWVPFDVAACMILGENIGTTVTAYLASLVGNVNSKRAARAHFIFNILGVVWMFFILPYFLILIDSLSVNVFDNPSVYSNVMAERGQAMPIALSLFHTVFNITNTFLLVWFSEFIYKAVVRLVPERMSDLTRTFRIDESLMIKTPELAILEVEKEIQSFGLHAQDMFETVSTMFTDEESDTGPMLVKVAELEDDCDRREMEINAYLTLMIDAETSKDTSDRIIHLISVADHLEKIGDLCFLITKLFEKKKHINNKFLDFRKDTIIEMIDGIKASLSVMNKALSYRKDPVDITFVYDYPMSYAKLKRNLLKEQAYNSTGKNKKEINANITFGELYSAFERIVSQIRTVCNEIEESKKNG